MRPTANLVLSCTRSLCLVLRVIMIFLIIIIVYELLWRRSLYVERLGCQGLRGNSRQGSGDQDEKNQEEQVVGNPEIFLQKNSVSRKRCRKVGAWPEINT